MPQVLLRVCRLQSYRAAARFASGRVFSDFSVFRVLNQLSGAL